MVVMYDGGVVATFEVNLQVKTQDLGDYWAARAQRLGVTVFADTEQAALVRLESSIKFLTTNAVAGSKTGVEQFKEYLNSRGVQYSYTERPAVSASRDTVQRIQHSYTEHPDRRWMPAQSSRPVRIESGVVISAA